MLYPNNKLIPIRLIKWSILRAEKRVDS